MRRLPIFVCIWLFGSVTTICPFQLNRETDQREAQTKDHQKPTQPLSVNVAGGYREAESPGVTSHNNPKPIRVTEMPSPERWYKAYVIATWILVLIGGFGVRYAVKTLRAIEAQGNTMLGQLDAMREQTAAISKSVETAKQSADAFINAERAWLHAEILNDAPERKMVPASTQYPVAVTNYGRTVGEITGYRFSADTTDGIERLLSDRGEMISLGTSGRRFVAPKDTVSIPSLDVKQILEYRGLWDEVVRERIIGAILIEIFYCDVLDRNTQRSSRFVCSYDAIAYRLNVLSEYTEYR